MGGVRVSTTPGTVCMQVGMRECDTEGSCRVLYSHDVYSRRVRDCKVDEPLCSANDKTNQLQLSDW